MAQLSKAAVSFSRIIKFVAQAILLLVTFLPTSSAESGWQPAARARPPKGMAIYRLPTGVTHRSDGFAYEGGSWRDKRDFAMTAVLVKHPKGDVLIDTGLGRDVAQQLKEMPLYFRLTTQYDRWTSAAEQLNGAGY